MHLVLKFRHYKLSPQAQNGLSPWSLVVKKLFCLKRVTKLGNLVWLQDNLYPKKNNITCTVHLCCYIITWNLWSRGSSLGTFWLAVKLLTPKWRLHMHGCTFCLAIGFSTSEFSVSLSCLSEVGSLEDESYLELLPGMIKSLIMVI